MTPKQQRWVEEYCIDFNAKQAAIRAGYSKKTAYSIGHENLSKPELKQIIDAKLAQLSEKSAATAEKVIGELTKIAFSDMNQYVEFRDDGTFYFDFSNLPEGATRVIGELTQDVYWEGRAEDSKEVKKTRFKLYDKLKALELLGKYFGIFTEKFEGTVKVEESPREKIESRIREIATRHAGSPSTPD